MLHGLVCTPCSVHWVSGIVSRHSYFTQLSIHFCTYSECLVPTAMSYPYTTALAQSYLQLGKISVNSTHPLLFLIY